MQTFVARFARLGNGPLPVGNKNTQPRGETIMRRQSAAYAIVVGGLIAGLIDISYALGFSALRGVAPTRTRPGRRERPRPR